MLQQADSQFKTRLAHARNAAGISQSALAARLGFSPQAVQRYEKGTAEPSFETLYRICDILG